MRVVMGAPSYVALRTDTRSVRLDLDATILNDMTVPVYLTGCGTAVFKLEQWNGSEWVVAQGRPESCTRIAHESDFVPAGESRTYEFRKASRDDRSQEWSWGETDISGTYRLTIGMYLGFDYDRQEWTHPLADGAWHSAPFEVAERCTVDWACGG